MCEELKVSLMAEEGAALSSGALRLYAMAHQTPLRPQPSDANPPTTDPLVGCVDLYDFDPYHRRAGIGIMVDGRLRHRGYGAAMLAAVEEFARQHLALHQLYSVVANDNHHSISLFGKAGYAPGGTLKEWTFADGRWVDATMYQKIIEK